MPHRRPLILTCAITAAAALAACGSSSPTSTSASNSGRQPNFAQVQQDVVRFSTCMRTHGVPNFPDPTTSPREFKLALGPDSGNARSPAFQSAVAECQHLLPGGGLSPQDTVQQTRARVADALAFARCMRAGGFPNFPDPTNQGELSPRMVTAAGIDLHQPALLRAGLACVHVTHGLLTAADIERAVHGG